MKVQNDFVLREIAGDYVIIPTGKTVLSFNGLITVNEVGADLWKMLQSEVSFDDLVQGILDIYDGYTGVSGHINTGRYSGRSRTAGRIRITGKRYRCITGESVVHLFLLETIALYRTAMLNFL